MTKGNAAPPERIREMFDRIAGVYDGMNALISGLQEPRWRRRAVREAALLPGMRALDVACGTGKVTASLHRAVSPGGSVAGVDVSTRMIERARAKVGRPGLTFVVGDALRLPVEDLRFDAATIAFGMRNLADYRRGFEEMRRAVKPGGRVVCLEIARPRSWHGRIIARWFDHAVPLVGRIIGQRDAYTYLVQSVREYPSPERIGDIMREAGLAQVRWFALSGGVVTIHVAIRADPDRIRVSTQIPGRQSSSGDRTGSAARLEAISG